MAPLVCRFARAKANHAALVPEVFDPQAQHRDLRLLPLPGIASGQPPEGVSEVIVHAPPGSGQKLEEIGQQLSRKGCIVAAETKEGPLLPVVELLARFLPVVPAGMLEQAQMDALTVRHLPIPSHLSRAAFHGRPHDLLFGNGLFPSSDQLQRVKAPPQREALSRRAPAAGRSGASRRLPKQTETHPLPRRRIRDGG